MLLGVATYRHNIFFGWRIGDLRLAICLLFLRFVFSALSF
jgi:hypothetical protein